NRAASRTVIGYSGMSVSMVDAHAALRAACCAVVFQFHPMTRAVSDALAKRLKITTADGNGAGDGAPTNVNRPRSKRISRAFITWSCHQAVSVRAGSRLTTIVPPAPSP